MQVELERQLRWLMTLRVVVVTTLLVSAFAIELLFRPAESLRPVFLLAAVSYGTVLFYAVLDRWLKGTRTFTFLQLIGDVFVITLFVQITGGVDSPMSFLYLLPIAVAAMLLYRRGALTIAAVGFAAYTGLILFGAALSALENGGESVLQIEPGRVTYFLVAHLIAMVAVALLSAYLSERLKVQGRELVERRSAVARLKALNENIIESINSGLITTGLDGGVNFINRGGTEIIGHSQDDVEGKGIEELMQFEENFIHDTRRRLLAERRFRFERHFRTPEGQEIFLGIAVSNLYDKIGKPLGYIFIFQDLTEIHALEQEVRLKERMAALGEMAAGMAHELRNPLAAISGSVQYLKGDQPPQAERIELMDIILRESHRLDQTIRDFLTFTRPGEFSSEDTEVVRLVEDSLKLLRKSDQFKTGLRIVTNYAEPEMECAVDANRLKQIFWNLATNALKAMPDGGTLSIDVEWAGGGDHVVFTFADDGVGMDERQKERYFQPFNSSFQEGTGLGAAIVYRLVQEHEGKIHVDSELGRGTRVRIELPRHASKSAEPVRQAAVGDTR